VAVGVTAWQLTNGLWRWVAAVIIPIAMATMWATFGVTDEESRGGTPPVRVPGAVRLALELSFFALAVLSLVLIDQTTWAIVFAGIVVLHYAISWDRIPWLLRTKATS
jgi:phosphatidylserine synthase